jgi:hypothetical protein
VTSEHLASDHHAKKVHWHKWDKTQRASKATAPATNTSAVTANTWLPAEAPASTSGTVAAATAASSASSVVVEAPAALAPATTQGGTIFIELPVAVAFALKDALERALAGRQQ